MGLCVLEAKTPYLMLAAFSVDNKGGDPGPMVWSILEPPPPSLGHALKQVGG